MTKHVAINAILAIGMLMVILTGGIDLSVGSIVGLAGMVAGVLLEGLHLGFVDIDRSTCRCGRRDRSSLAGRRPASARSTACW